MGDRPEAGKRGISSPNQPPVRMQVLPKPILEASELCGWIRKAYVGLTFAELVRIELCIKRDLLYATG